MEPTRVFFMPCRWRIVGLYYDYGAVFNFCRLQFHVKHEKIYDAHTVDFAGCFSGFLIHLVIFTRIKSKGALGSFKTMDDFTQLRLVKYSKRL